MASLERFGQRRPVVVNRRNKQIEAGNATHEAAKRLGWSYVAVVWVTDDKAAQTGFALADNRTAELAGWSEEMLAEALIEVGQSDAGLAEALLLDGLAAEHGQIDPEVVDMPDLPSGDREPFQQMTFTLSDEQAEDVKRALAAAKDAGPFVDTGNENSNGNALARIVEAYLGTG